MQKKSLSDVSRGGPASLITFAEACTWFRQQVKAIEIAGSSEAANCDLVDALGRRLAVSLIADRDQPPFPRVTRDGFAVRAQDVTSGGLLRVIGQLRAGEAWPSGNSALALGRLSKL